MAPSSNRPHVLLVEPVRRWRLAFVEAAKTAADVDAFESFTAARACLDARRFDLVVASLRLGAYNGIHLAYAARLLDAATHVLIHSDARDAAAARDVLRAHALYERTERLLVALPAYLAARLPDSDRRDPARHDRRRISRGGRRAWDQRPPDTDLTDLEIA